MLFQIHKNIPREGPGTNAITRKAYSFLENLPPHPRIIDVGCGPGKQTIELEKVSKGLVTGIDVYQPFLNRLKKKAKIAGANIDVLNCSMDKLPYQKESIDVIWGEGSIYNIGFERGIKYYYRFLKPNGYLAVSEITWLRNYIPKKCNNYWRKNYSEMGTIADKAQLIQKANYSFIGHFVLSPESWWKEYYSYIEKRINSIETKVISNNMKKLIQLEREEMEMHRKYSEYYSYVFYIMKK